jgi:hypothetical protein
MDKDNYVWKYKSISYIFPILMGIIAITLDYRMSLTRSSNNETITSFPLLLTITIPVIAIWLLATYGATRLKSYAHSIRASNDGKNLNYIANGLLWLVVYLLLLPTANPIEGLFVNSRYLRLSVILGNHTLVVLGLISVYLLLKGTRGLVPLTQRSLRGTPLFTVFSLVSGAFLIFFAWSFYRSVPTLMPVNGVPKFALPAQLLLFTYVLPYILMWIGGLLAVRNLSHYALKTKGSVYKSLFRDLYKGILVVYICIFIAQMLVISTISYTSFNISIGLIYALLVLSAIGFLLVAKGSKKLAGVEMSG